MMAAVSAAETNPKAKVFLLEKNEKLGKKVFITGKGRGNLTNACDISDLFAGYVSNGKFLYTALYDFTNRDVMRFMENGGCRVKTERGNRVFPVSDHAYSITDCMKHYLKKLGVNIGYNTEVTGIRVKNGAVAGVSAKNGDYPADAVIVATGGLAYPETGSTGDGYRFAREAGMTVSETYPSLVHFVPEESDWFRMRGLKLKNISITVSDEDGKVYYSDFGELDFVNQGISGPVVISASTAVTKYLNAAERARRKILTLHIDLKPALDEKQLDERLQRELQEAGRKELRNTFADLLPAQLLPTFQERLERRGIDPNQRATEVSRESRHAVTALLKDFTYTIRGTGSFREAIVTQGGVCVRDINPKTMESRKIRGLYFAGEVLDIDGYTGGFNMQCAFSTGHLAGRSAASQTETKDVSAAD